MFAIPRLSARFTRLLPVTAGAFLGSSALYYQRCRVLNDSPMASRPGPGESIAKYAEPMHGKGLSRFNGKLDYHQLTFGSFVGMISGYFFGRISKILVGAIVTSLMTTEYLAASGHVDLRPAYAAIYRWCRDHFHQEILVEDPSFKYSFGLAFLIAAYNA